MFGHFVNYLDMKLFIHKSPEGFKIQTQHCFRTMKLPLWPSVQSSLKIDQIKNVYVAIFMHVLSHSNPAALADESKLFVANWMQRKGFSLEFVLLCQKEAHSKFTHKKSKLAGGMIGTKVFVPALVLPLGLQQQLVKYNVNLQFKQSFAWTQDFDKPWRVIMTKKAKSDSE